jgi:GNAT superfamily N-acetyltransferase
MKISPLADCPHLAPVVAQWHFDEWGHLYPGGTVDGWLDHIRTRINADRIPMTIVALDDDGQPVGTAALTEHDMETHRELSPWLGGVYVVPRARRRGVASALVRDLMGRAADFEIRDLHLYTNGAEGLYRKLDWRVLSRELYMGREVTIMTSTPSSGPLERSGLTGRSTPFR